MRVEPDPSPSKSGADKWLSAEAPQRREPTILTALFLTVAVDLSILCFLTFAYSATVKGTENGIELVKAALSHWDAQHYLEIVRDGYSAPHLAARPPLYPMVVSFIAPYVTDATIAAVLLSLVSHITAVWLFYRLTELDEPAEVAWRATTFLVLFPTAAVYVVPYSESMFLALTVGSVYAFRRQIFLLAGLLAGLSTLCRVTGFLLVVLLFVEWLRLREERVFAAILPVFLGTGIGVLGYLALNVLTSETPLAFLEAHEQLSSKRVSFPWVGMMQALGSLNRPPPENITVGASDFIGGVFPCLVAIYAFCRMRTSYACYVAAGAALITCQTWWQSSLRYTAVVFPIYIMLGRVSGNRLIYISLLCVCLLGLTFLSLQFARGWWAF